MKDHNRSLIIGIALLFISVIYIAMYGYKVAILTGILSVVWMGKAFVEWREIKK